MERFIFMADKFKRGDRIKMSEDKSTVFLVDYAYDDTVIATCTLKISDLSGWEKVEEDEDNHSYWGV